MKAEEEEEEEEVWRAESILEEDGKPPFLSPFFFKVGALLISGAFWGKKELSSPYL